MYKALIVDDEKPQQEILSKLLAEHVHEIEVADVCRSVDDGIRRIIELQPQLVFLDVMMPPKTGFDLLAAFSKINFEIIFTTSYQEFALQAIKLSAIDYLLKPFDEEQLIPAIKKFEERMGLKDSYRHVELLMSNIKTSNLEETKIALPTQTGYVFAKVNEIVHCTSDNSYTTFYFIDKSKLMVSKSLKDCEELLFPYHFFRTHSRHLINMAYIKEYIKGEGGQVRMIDGSMVDVSRQRKEEFLLRLQRL
ncbi:MAG TPA: LytTR family DNA-binding domain-containing protein [Bacteroidia bacterium]|nr:LytTR family DNA-binding domain-containing protein [Bacteroidia bacterium]HNU31963.1 LytTR family DNA-binding domain-containing protein [Bacteroidia bacterium]